MKFQQSDFRNRVALTGEIRFISDLSHLNNRKNISDLNAVHVSKLIQESEKEGYRFVSRLASEYEDGTHRFSEQGEAIYGAWDEDELVAIGGLFRNPASEAENSARLYDFIHCLNIGERV